MVFPRTEGNLTSAGHQQFNWDLQYLNGCKDTSNCVSYTGALGLEKLDFINFQLYPNPTKGNFSIKTDYEGSYSLTISDLNGKAVMDKNNILNGTEVNVSEIETGTYFIPFYSENETITRRLIKQ